MKKILVLTCILALALSFNGYAQLAEEPLLPKSLSAEPGAYHLNPLQPKGNLHPELLNVGEAGEEESGEANFPTHKMGVGVINTTTAWTEIPRQISRVSEESNLFLGLTLGFGEGLFSGIKQGASGVIDMATFGLPPYDEPLAEPQYRVQKPQEGFKVSILRW